MPGGGGVLAIAGVEVDWTEIDEMGMGVLRGFEISLNVSTDFRTGLSRNGDHDNNLGGRTGAQAKLCQGGDDGLGLRRSVLTEVDQNDVRARDKLIAC